MARGSLRWTTPLLRACSSTRAGQTQHGPLMGTRVVRGKSVSVTARRYQSGVAQITDTSQQMNQRGNTSFYEMGGDRSLCPWRACSRRTNDTV